MIEAASALIGGATPFGWAGLAASILGSAGKAQSAPPGQSSADALFGSSLVAPDFANWNVVIGGGDGSMTTGDKTGPTQSPIQSLTKPATNVNYPISSPGGGYSGSDGGSPGGGVGMTPPVNGGVNTFGGIPMEWLLIGLAGVLLWKKL